MLIGLSGYAQSGKDTVASIFGEFGFERVAFADLMREAALAFDPIISPGSVEPLRLSDVVAEFDWDVAKVEIPEVRRTLQRLGTEVGRSLLGEDVWVNALFSRLDLDNQDYVVSDCRFPNEAQRIVDEGGLMVRVSRRFGPANDHLSEVALDGWDFNFRLINNGTIEDLRRDSRQLLKALVSLSQRAAQ